MRHDTIRKTERNQRLVEYHDNHPGESWREVGIEFGITKQTAHAIYQRATGHHGYGYGKGETNDS